MEVTRGSLGGRGTFGLMELEPNGVQVHYTLAVIGHTLTGNLFTWIKMPLDVAKSHNYNLWHIIMT